MSRPSDPDMKPTPLHKRPHGQKSRHLIQPVELQLYHTDRNGDIFYQRGEQVSPEDVCYMRAPMDAPAYLRWQRVMQKQDSTAPKHFIADTLARTLEIDCFTFGVKVFVRIGTDGTLKVFAEDADGMDKLQEWKKE